MTDPKPPCSKCGQVHPGCNRHNRFDLPCRRGVARNSPVCVFHGGRRAAVKLNAAVKSVEEDARALLPPRDQWQQVTSAVDELYAISTEQRAVREMLLRLVGELQSVVTTDDFGRQSIVPALLAAQAALESSTKVNASIARMRIDERRLELAERDRLFVREIITAALVLFGIPASDARLAEVMPRTVRKVALA